MLTAYSLEAPVSEEPFLRRELGLAWSPVGEDELADVLRKRRAVIIVSEPQAYQRLLADAPPRSAVLVLISDEGYAPERLALVRDAASVRSAYRQYAARPATLAQILNATAGFMTDARGTTQASRTAIPNGSKGRQTRGRMQAWASAGKPVHDVPLGYTSTFEEAFVRTGGVQSDDGSLFASPRDGGDRPISVTFRGNRGLAARIVGMELAERIPGSDIGTIDADWSGFAEGDVGRSYVEALSSARFALCPPGFVNNESFRYYEALLCGALPIELVVALTHQGIATARSPRALVRYSWRQGLTEAQAMPEAERRDAVVAARTLVAEQLAQIRAQLAADVEG